MDTRFTVEPPVIRTMLKPGGIGFTELYEVWFVMPNGVRDKIEVDRDTYHKEPDRVLEMIETQAETHEKIVGEH